MALGQNRGITVGTVGRWYCGYAGVRWYDNFEGRFAAGSVGAPCLHAVVDARHLAQTADEGADRRSAVPRKLDVDVPKGLDARRAQAEVRTIAHVGRDRVESGGDKEPLADRSDLGAELKARRDMLANLRGNGEGGIRGACAVS